MKIYDEIFKINHENLADANLLYLSITDRTNSESLVGKNNVSIKKNTYGYILSKVKTDNKKNYSIVIECKDAISMADLDCLVFDKEVKDNPDLVKEYFVNGLGGFLTFKDNAYIKIINDNDPGEIDLVFTNYLEALEYLGQVNDE